MQQAKTESRRFATAGAGLGNHVMPFQHKWQALCLHRRHGGVTQGIQVGEQFRRQRQGSKRGISHGSSLWQRKVARKH